MGDGRASDREAEAAVPTRMIRLIEIVGTPPFFPAVAGFGGLTVATTMPTAYCCGRGGKTSKVRNALRRIELAFLNRTAAARPVRTNRRALDFLVL